MSQNGKVEAHRTFSPHFPTTTLAISFFPPPSVSASDPSSSSSTIDFSPVSKARSDIVCLPTHPLLSPFLFLPPAHTGENGKEEKGGTKAPLSPLGPAGGGGSKKSLYLHAFPELEAEEEKLFSFPLFPPYVCEGKARVLLFPPLPPSPGKGMGVIR